MARIQCNHVEGWSIDPETKKLVFAEGEIDLSQAPDRAILLGETKLVISLCPACAAALKQETAKW